MTSSLSQSYPNRKIRRGIDRYGSDAFTGRSKHHGNRSHRQVSEEYRDMLWAGREKIRELFLRAGILVIPFEDYELKSILQEANEAYLETGLVPVDVQTKLMASGHDVEAITKIWDMMKIAEVDPDAFDSQDGQQVMLPTEDQPLNRFV